MTIHPTPCVSRAQPGLNKLVIGVAAALALLGSAPAMAGVVNFESLEPSSYYLGGDTLTESGYTLQAIDNHAGTSGAVGALANGLDPTVCALGGCPTNNTSHFYLGLADGGLTFARNDGGAFLLKSLDYAFVAPTGGQPDYSYGQLVVSGSLANGSTIGTAFNFAGTDSSGNPLFDKALFAGTFASTAFTSVTFSACLFDGIGGCKVAADINDQSIYQAQFALDNVALAEVPEPGSLALLGLGVSALVLRRRKSAASSTNA